MSRESSSFKPAYVLSDFSACDTLYFEFSSVFDLFQFHCQEYPSLPGAPGPDLRGRADVSCFRLVRDVGQRDAELKQSELGGRVKHTAIAHWCWISVLGNSNQDWGKRSVFLFISLRVFLFRGLEHARPEFPANSQ